MVALNLRTNMYVYKYNLFFYLAVEQHGREKMGGWI